MKNERAISHSMVEASCANSATLRCVCAFNSGCLAAIQAAALGSGRQSAIEQPTITATSRFITGQRRGKCHTPKLILWPLTWHTEETGIAANYVVKEEHEDDPCSL